MRVRRLLAALLTTGLVAPAAAVIATSGTTASAATATRIVSGSTSEGWISLNKYSRQPGPGVYGDTLSLSINVQDANGQQVYDGSLVVQKLAKGSRAWSTVASSSSAYLYETVKLTSSATYRVLYSGTSEYSPSGAAASVKAQRDLNTTPVDNGRQFGIKGKVTKYKKKPVLVQKKVGKKWKKFSKVRTDKKGRFFARVKAPAKVGGKTPYRIVVKASGGFATSTSVTYTATKSRYRSAARVIS